MMRLSFDPVPVAASDDASAWTRLARLTIPTTAEDTPLAEIAAILERNRIKRVPITQEGKLVHLWGLVGSPAERKALVALAEGVPGVTGVADEMIAAY